MSREHRTNVMARRLLAAREPQLPLLVPLLIDGVSEELGAQPLTADHKWPVDLVDAAREFLTCVASNDLERISGAGSIFERVGVEAGRGGVDAETLSSVIRLAARLTQAQVHRAIISEGLRMDTESTLELLARVLAGAEAVVTAARRGCDLAGLACDGEEDELARRLAGELIHGGVSGALAADFGWDGDDLVCAILVPADSAARIRREAVCPIAYFSREHDVVLIHPVAKGELATTLRPRLSEHECFVGPAGPLAEFRESLDLAQRAANLALGGVGPTFVDDVLFELACCADPVIVRALRRKHLGHVERESGERWVLLETLYEWLLQWGHRPHTATALTVHPQTVSGRVNRVKDLLADDLTDPGARSELLVLLTAITTFSTRDPDFVPWM